MKIPTWWRILLGAGLLGGAILGLSATFVFLHFDDTFEGEAQCAVIFGAAVWRDDQPSHALEDRVLAAIDLYKKEQVACLIFSGGPSKIGMHEADVMARMARDAGIDESVFRYDYAGLNTQKTLQNLPEDVESFVMVSNDFHLARIRLIAWKEGIENVSLHAAPYNHGHYARRGYFISREVLGVPFYALLSW